MEERYIPVSSAFLDELEELAALRTPCAIQFWQEGAKAAIHGKIDKVFQSADAGYLLMDSGLSIRLDRIIDVNGQFPHSFC